MNDMEMKNKLKKFKKTLNGLFNEISLSFKNKIGEISIGDIHCKIDTFIKEFTLFSIESQKFINTKKNIMKTICYIEIGVTLFTVPTAIMIKVTQPVIWLIPLFIGMVSAFSTVLTYSQIKSYEKFVRDMNTINSKKLNLELAFLSLCEYVKNMYNQNIIIEDWGYDNGSDITR